MVHTYDNDEYKTEGGPDTKDKVFLLSCYDMNNSLYLNDLEDFFPCRATEYAIQVHDDEYRFYFSITESYIEEDDNVAYWLRTPGKSQYVEATKRDHAESYPTATFVNENGDIDFKGDNGEGFVRPALFIRTK